MVHCAIDFDVITKTETEHVRHKWFFQNAVEVWSWMNNNMTHKTIDIITYPRFRNKKMPSHQYRNSPDEINNPSCGDQTALLSSYRHNGIFPFLRKGNLYIFKRIPTISHKPMNDFQLFLAQLIPCADWNNCRRPCVCTYRLIKA